MSGQLKSGVLWGLMQARTQKKEGHLPLEMPLYRQISESLLNGIREGKFPVGSFLPGELDLIDRYAASRHTIREALRVLEDLGLVDRRRGRGTMVISKDAAPAYVQMVRSPSELFNYPDNSIFRFLSECHLQADGPLAKELGCAVGKEWVQISGLRILNEGGLPICFAEVYVIPEYGSIAESLEGNRRPVYEMIATCFNERIEKITVSVYASILCERKAHALGIEAFTPSLKVRRCYQGTGGRNFEVSVSEHPADNFSYNFEFARGWQTAERWTWGS